MRVLLLVEGRRDGDVAWMLLDRARIPLHDLEIRPCGGRSRLLRAARDWKPDPAGGVGSALAVLLDADGSAPEDVAVAARASIGRPEVQVFVAVPNVDNWVIGNPSLALALKRRAHAIPELDLGAELDLLAAMVDLELASAVDPSLRAFLAGMAALLQVPGHRWADVPGRHLSRDIVAGLLREVPPDEVVWRASDGTTRTAADLGREVQQGTELGRQYASDLLRIARDLLARRARKVT